MHHASYREQDHAFGRLMLALRSAIGLSQVGLAELLGVSRHAVSAWETGQTYPKVERLKQLIALGVQHQAFPAGREAEEIRALWRAAHQKVLLDEAWLQSLLEQPTVPAVAVSLVRHVPHNLPRALTPCLGRAAETAALARYLADPDRRLITIVGIGGIGKTRLALETAWGMVNDRAGGPFHNGVYFVPLADVDIPQEDSVHGADLLATAIADALHFALSGADRPYQQVTRYLRDQHALLILDNLEHVLHLTAALVQLLQQAPALTILATSSVRLDVAGEQVVPLDGLPYAPLDLPTLAEEASVALQLFQQVAAFHAPQPHWSPKELAVAAEICAQVEGVPLAIELAASLVRLLSLEEIAAELSAGSTVLHSAQRERSARHRSLRAVFDHSWRLLSPHEQRVVAALSIFRGGFDRHAAQAVADADLGVIATLINHSLVRESAQEQSITRYGLHALVREYAAEQLQAGDPAAHTHIADRHSRYYLDWVAARLPELRSDRQQVAQVAIHREIGNLRAAWRWAVARSDIPALVAAGRALFHFYDMRSRFQEGAELLQLAAGCCEPLAQTGDRTMTRAWAQLLARQGWLTFHLGQFEVARALLSRSLSLLATFPPSEDHVFTLNYLAAVSYHLGSYGAAEHLGRAALATSVAVGDTYGTAIAKTLLSQIAYVQGAYREAQHLALESLTLEQTLGNRWGMVFTLISLGRVAVALEAYEDARRWFTEGLAIRELMGDARGSGLCLTYLGDVARALGDDAEAERQYQASLARFRQIHNSAGIAIALTKLGALALALHDQPRAQRLLHEALGTAWSIHALPATLDALAGLADVRAADEPERAAAWAALVMQHPATTQHSRQQATHLYQRLAAAHASLPADDPQRALEALVPRLLAASTMLEQTLSASSRG